ncbi:MAG: type II toxin-antitoxin system PemK/MazF family toxin [Patescibacteria group bacterium]|nr:type II toxin-antitoxin system PemK/MazF family toxin [Patescibacteria group bacterium]
MYIKDFDRWNTVKKNMQISERMRIFHERDIWWCSLGVNIGDEQDGKNNLFERPVLVIKKFNNKIALILPMSTKIKDNRYYLNMKDESILLSQVRLVSSKRFNRYIRRMSTYDFMPVIMGVVDMLVYA